jgi:hypothetical protein
MAAAAMSAVSSEIKRAWRPLSSVIDLYVQSSTFGVIRGWEGDVTMMHNVAHLLKEEVGQRPRFTNGRIHGVVKTLLIVRVVCL